MERIWITAEFALQLLTEYNRTYENTHPTHVILPYVLDWWNIKGINGFLNYERCYYGDNIHKLPTTGAAFAFGDKQTTLHQPPSLFDATNASNIKIEASNF